MNRFLLNISVYLAALLFTGVARVNAAEIVLKYSLTETRTPLATQAKAPKKEKEVVLSSKKTVVFGSGFFSIKEKKLERIYDFKQKRIHYLDHQSKTRSEISLFSDLAFRVQEFHHRIEMIESVEKAGGRVPEDQLSLESIFGIENQEKKTIFSEDLSEKDKIKFLKEKQVVSEIAFSENRLDAENNMFKQFLIYDNSLHPKIRKKIIESQKIPSVIRSRLESLDGGDHFVLILDSFNTQKDQGFNIPLNYAFSKKRPGAVAAAEPLESLVQSDPLGKNKKLYHGREWFEKRILEAQGDKNYLEVALLVLEYGLQTGDHGWSSKEIEKLAVHQKDHAELDRFFKSLGISGKNQAERAIAELQKINRKKLNRDHMIDIMIANQQSVLGQNDKAQKKMLAALKANPFITGAYKDLGDMFYADFDMASAWLCWDFARKRVPDHFMLKPISEYEKELLSDFPDFF